MDNANYQADLESWLRSGTTNTVDGKEYIYWRWLYLDKKISLKELYDSMIRSDIKFPTEFKQKRKVIEFKRLAGCEPIVYVKGKTVYTKRHSKNTKVSGIDIGAIKNAVKVVKDAAQGNDAGEIITTPEQFFELLNVAMFQLLYEKISEKGIKVIRKS